MEPLDTLTIFGAGLIGGSVAWAAQRAGLARRIVAVDRRPAPAFSSPFDDWCDASDEREVARATQGASLILLATPVHSIIAELPRALASGAIVSDCGSTKRAIRDVAASLPGSERFVPGHPMAGRPVGGLEHATPDLFEGRRWLLCPEDVGQAALERLRHFVRALGATPVELSASEHDRSVAITSHLPQVLASALAVLAEQENASIAAGPGLASATRVAGGAESMWRDIFETNGPEVGRALLQMAERLAAAGRALEVGDPSVVLSLLEQARQAKGSLES